MSTTAASATTTSTTDSEEDEVRTLLLRHRSIIKRDLVDTNLLAILVKKNVLNIIEENLINNEITNDNKSFKLIDIIAKSGFQKFKEFCYAIENECEQLITDLITDRFKYDTETNNGNSVNINRDTLDSSRSRRSTSYCGSITPTPNSSSRRSSVVINNPLLSSTPQPNQSPLQQHRQPQQRQRSPTPVTITQQLNNNNNNFNNINQNINSLNINRPNSTIITPLNVPISTLIEATSQLYTTNTIPSPLIRKKNKTNIYRNGSLGRNGDLSETKKKSKKKDPLYNRGYYSMNETIEVLADPVFEEDPTGDRTSWEYHTVTVTRVPGYGFGIAVSGGRDNPHFANGDPSIAVSDVLKGGPAEDRLQVNDRIISVNGVSLENVEYATAVQVLRDSGNTVTLVIKRRVPNYNIMTSPNHSHQHSHSLSSTGLGGAATPAQQTIKLILNKANKKDDFGVVLGCRLFVKEISSKAREQLTANGYTLQEGDIVTRIHNTNCNDSMSLKESKKIIDGCKERLNLVVLRDIAVQSNSGMQSPIYSHTAQVSNCSNVDESFLPGGQSYSAQNLYVQPPTRPSAVSTLLDDKSNLTPRGRSRGPLMDVSLSQLDRPSTPQGVLGAGAGTHARSRSTDEPPRPPPPRGEDFYSSRRQLYEDDPLQRSKQSAEPRFISFQKEGSVGIRLTGGNEAGIFVTAVQPGSPASLQGLTPGDKILKVNDMDMHGVTREEAVLFLLSLQDRIDLIVQHCKEEYDNVVANQRGDSFHIKTHFHCDNPSKGEMAFRAGDVFRVIDTLHNGVVGSWQVLRIGRGHQEMQRGVIPNKSRAEELATAQFNATKKEMNASESRSGFFRRRRSTHRRSKSLSRENWDDVVFSDSISKFPAYERVVLRHPGFVRPVVLFGPTADLARERLIKDFPDKFTAPLQDDDKSASKCGIVRLSNIRDIMDRGKHALLDITPNAVDRLNYAQFYPIVIFMKADSKHMIKQLRQGIPKSAHKSSKKLLEQCQKLERVWSHIFSSNFVLNDTETWYRKLRESVDQQQSGAVWMSETKPVESLSDDFLFPMQTSRLSYASSPESDLELSPGPSASLSLGNLPQLVKSSSDPSIATNQDNLDRDRELNLGDGMPPPYTNPYDHSVPSMGHHSRRPMMDTGKYGFSSNGGGPRGSSLPLGQPENGPNFASPISAGARPPPPMTHRDSSGQAIYGGLTAPDLPPRVDRASKPPGLSQMPNPQSRSGGTLGRSAQERLFGSKSQQLGVANGEDMHDDYATRTQLLMNSPDKRTGSGNSLDRLHSSLDRQRGSTSVGNGVIVPPGVGGVPGSNKVINNNGSYDSVSSYDSYNTTQMSVQNIRLGPNAPDDLKSVPNVNGGRQPNGTESAVIGDSMTPQRNSSHLHGDGLLMTGNPMHEHSRSLSTGGNANDLSRQSTPGRPTYHGDGSGPRNIAMNPHDALNARNSNPHDGRPSGISLPQRPSNLAIDPISGGSPRKQPPFETKTDYGKYSRNNSATQADYKSSPKSSKIGPPLPQGNGAGNGGTPFKPVPPPKPKNYRPPVQSGGNGSGNGNGNGGQINSGQWENEPTSPRSPNGFYYPPPNTSHYHHSTQNTPTSPNGNHMGGNGNNGMSYGQYVAAAAADGSNGHYGAGQYSGGNGMYNGGGGGGASHPYGGQYMHRPPITNIHHPSDRHALDLASSREQRGSAFELYRKPQIGAGVGHHHNMSDLEQQQQHQHHLQQQRYIRGPDGMYGNRTVITDNNGVMMLSNDLNESHLRQQQEYYASHMSPSTTPPPLPPPLKPKRKNSVLKSIKNAFIKTTKPLRRQNSMIETSTPMSPSGTRKLRPVRRQQSMLEATYSNRQNQNQQNMNHQLMMMEMDVSDLQRNGAMAPVYIDQYGRIMMPVRHEPFYQNNGNRSMRGGSNSRDLESTYQNLEESESMYGNMRGPNENLYANRALIELERQAANSELEGRGSGRRIIRRHSMADRSVIGPMYRQISRDRNGQNENINIDESIYQSRGGSYMIDNNRPANDRQMIDSRSMGRRDNLKVRRADSFNSCNIGPVDPIYQSRREMHRDHLYQSRKEMQERIHQGRKEAERVVSGTGIIEPLTRGRDGESPVSSGSRSSNDPVYQTRKELKENGFKTRTQLREHLYQTRRETMESMAEPIYVSSRRQHEGTPIREHESIRESKESGLDDPTPTSTSDNLASGSADACGLSPCSTDKSPEKSLLVEVMAAMAIKESESDEILRLEQEQINGQMVVTAKCIDETDDAKNREKESQQHLNDLGQDLNYIDSNDDTLTSTTKDSIDISNILIYEDGRSPQRSMPSTPMSVRSARIPYHLSNIIKRTAPAPMPPSSPTIDCNPDTFPTTLPSPMDIKEPLVPLAGQVYASRTSIETQYISQASLPVGPPNAQSTPYASEMSLPKLQIPPPPQTLLTSQLPTNTTHSLPTQQPPITRRGVFDESGGILADPIWDVSLVIPPGAIPAGITQEIYFTISDPRISQSIGGPPLDMENGETMLSPLVMCGPQGLEFNIPVTLNIPHCAGNTTSLGLSLKATDSENNLKTNWDNIELPSNTAAHTVSVKVDHF